MQILSHILTLAQLIFLIIAPLSSYTEGVIGQPKNFLPGFTETENDRTISSLLYRGLFKYDNFGSLVPDLAESWTISDNETVYTIKIKPNQYWSDGSKISSKDLVYTAFKHPDLTGVATDVVDDQTVRYTLPNKYSPFLSLMTIAIMKSDAVEKEDPLRPITSGQFRVIRVDKAGPVTRQVILGSMDDTLEVRKLCFRFYENEDEIILATKLGEIDAFVSNKTTGDSLENFSNHKFPIQGVYYALFFNLRNEKFKDVALRQKFEKVLPIEEMIYSRGIGVQGPISRNVYTDRSVVQSKFDSNFKEILPEMNVIISVPDVKSQVALAEEIKKIWESKLGINVSVRKVNPDTFISTVVEPRNFEILLYGQEVGRDPDRYIYWHTTQSEHPGLNLSGFSQIRADRALEEGRNEVDQEKRVVHYHEFQKVIADNTPAIFLFHPYYNHYVSKFIEGIGEKYTFEPKDRFLDLANWKHVSTN